ncbi:MAG: hypothetical protein ACRDIZ_07645 [Actinomycetota bacterium]
MARDEVTPPDPDLDTESGWGRARRITFYAVIALLLANIGGLFWKVNLFWFFAWLPEDFLERLYASQLEFDRIGGSFAPHVVHYLALSASHVMVLFGLALQLRRPRTRVAPIWQAAGGLFLSILTLPLALVSVGPSQIPPAVLPAMALVVTAALLHPGNPVRKPPKPADPLMTGLWAIAVIPAALLTIAQVRLELNGVSADPHWRGLHYHIMAEYGVHVVLVGLLGASALSGWRYSAWSASFMVALLGVGFIVYPDLSGSQGTGWGVAMITWAVLYFTAGEVRHQREGVSIPSRRPSLQQAALR